MKTMIQAGLIGLVVGGFMIVSGAWYLSTGFLQPVHPECQKTGYVYCNTPAELGLRYRNVLFETADGVTISGWYVPGRSNAPGILMVPGIGDTRHVALRYVPSLNAQGFNLLLIDLRNTGKSGGSFNTMGFHERKDVQAGITYLLTRKKLNAAGVFGFSTGAGIAIMAMAENKKIRAGVFESGFTDFEALTEQALRNQYGSTALILFPLATLLFEVRAQIDVQSLAPLKSIALISPRPVFVIHGAADPTIDFDQGKRLFVAAQQPKRFWPVFQSGHVQAWQGDRQRAEKEIPEFFKRYLPSASAASNK